MKFSRHLDLPRLVEPEVIVECLQLAMQVPTVSNEQNRRWMVITDADNVQGEPKVTLKLSFRPDDLANFDIGTTTTTTTMPAITPWWRW